VHGRAEDQKATGLEDASHFTECPQRFRHVLQNLRADHRVKLPAGKRQVQRRANHVRPRTIREVVRADIAIRASKEGSLVRPQTTADIQGNAFDVAPALAQGVLQHYGGQVGPLVPAQGACRPADKFVQRMLGQRMCGGTGHSSGCAEDQRSGVVDAVEKILA